MKKSNISHDDAETIMITLDQVSQTIDVMNSIVTRLKHRMSNSMAAQLQTELRDTRTADSCGNQSSALDALKNGSIH